jgi:hypothetical protein
MPRLIAGLQVGHEQTLVHKIMHTIDREPRQRGAARQKEFAVCTHDWSRRSERDRIERQGEELTVGQRARLGRLRLLLVDALASFLFNRLQQIRYFLSFGTNEPALH